MDAAQIPVERFQKEGFRALFQYHVPGHANESSWKDVLLH